MANGAVGAIALAVGAVTAPALAVGAVTAPALASNAVHGGHVVDGILRGPISVMRRESHQSSAQMMKY